MLGFDSRNRLVGIEMLYASLESVHFIEKALTDLAHIAFVRQMEDGTGASVTTEERESIRGHLKYVLRYADKLEMTDIAHLIHEIFRPKIDTLDPLSVEDVHLMRERISDSLQGVLSSYGCLLLTKKENALFESNEKEWEAVISKWGVLSYDIKESGKCIAIGRSTAAVFHLMRILEKSAQLLLQDLGITHHKSKAVEDIVMKFTLDALGNKIKELENPQQGQKDKERVQKLSEAYTLLFACKEAWRNPVMHPGSIWTEEQALDIYGSTRKFMFFLSSII